MTPTIVDMNEKTLDFGLDYSDFAQYKQQPSSTEDQFSSMSARSFLGPNHCAQDGYSSYYNEDEQNLNEKWTAHFDRAASTVPMTSAQELCHPQETFLDPTIAPSIATESLNTGQFHESSQKYFDLSYDRVGSNSSQTHFSYTPIELPQLSNTSKACYVSPDGERENYAEANGFTLLQRYPFENKRPSYSPNKSIIQYHRVKTNLRKRERNLSINKAFDNLRNRIPNLPSDTKVSKIKVLRLAADYIKYLGNVLQKDKTNSSSSNPCEDSFFISEDEEICHETNNNKRQLDEFKIDPNMVAIKRRKTDWNRIQEEIERHEKNHHIRQIEKRKCPEHLSLHNFDCDMDLSQTRGTSNNFISLQKTTLGSWHK
ncbi:uncharacterized protein LOC143465499 isoform X1 [Clavelina lepadiformis]|uniref:uncharacterized protein LOC143465499 isoform X1 n=1 Tax=Clavelina lepadiformis TaxID=159417 RepID=UPI004043765A